jgi:precorrin-2 C20-methyltransferase/precorrin-3B C17-methyltransferase
MYLHDRLAGQFRCEVVPGVTSMTAAAAAAGIPLARHEDVLSVLPGTLPIPELARRLTDTDAAVIMKLGRTFDGVREALRQAGRLESARYVERATTGGEHTRPVAEVDPRSVPYFSMIVVPGTDRRQDSAGRHAAHPPPEPVEGPTRPEPVAERQLLVVGLGPGPSAWLTPEVSTALAEVDHVVGYSPYLDRIPARPGLRRHPSGNTVELDRARFALDLARSGERVAVVSGGDAGVFGMASAVFEAAADDRYAGITITVLPAVTAAQAVAARAGAPLGGDYAVLSLSDRLKPWPVIEERLRAVAAADLVLAIYNPASQSRRDQIGEARRILLEQRDPATPVVVGRNVGRPGESLAITTLDDLDSATIDMSCLLIVGSSQTHVAPDGRVWTSRSQS